MSGIYPLATKSFYGLTYPITKSHEMTRFIDEVSSMCHKANVARMERKSPLVIGVAPEPIIDSGLVLTLYALNPLELDMTQNSFSEKVAQRYLRTNQYSIQTKLYDNSATVAADVCNKMIGKIPTDLLQDPLHIVIFPTEKFYRTAIKYGGFKNGELR